MASSIGLASHSSLANLQSHVVPGDLRAFGFQPHADLAAFAGIISHPLEADVLECSRLLAGETWEFDGGLFARTVRPSCEQHEASAGPWQVAIADVQAVANLGGEEVSLPGFCQLSPLPIRSPFSQTV